MEKYYSLISVAFSVFVLIMLPLHHQLVTTLGSQDALNMVFGLPIGIVTACNFKIILHKIRGKK